MFKQNRNRHLKNALVAAFCFGAVCAIVASAGTIVGSIHDFSASGWNPTGEICVVCHTPHNAQDDPVTGEPMTLLWNHEVTSTDFDMYDSPTFQGKDTQATNPTGNSLLCLSCHDGSVAIDAFGGRTGSIFMGENNPATVGANGDLRDDHPISFTYDSALADVDGSLALPDDTNVILGSDKTREGTITQVMLYDQQLQCASCHDVHNNFVADDPLLKISNASSGLCLTCHTK
jgi:hypothetical protein